MQVYCGSETLVSMPRLDADRRHGARASSCCSSRISTAAIHITADVAHFIPPVNANTRAMVVNGVSYFDVSTDNAELDGHGLIYVVDRVGDGADILQLRTVARIGGYSGWKFAGRRRSRRMSPNLTFCCHFLGVDRPTRVNSLKKEAYSALAHGLLAE